MPEGNIVIPELAAWLLLAVLAIVLLLVFTFTALVLHVSRRRRLEGAPLLDRREPRRPHTFSRANRTYLELPTRWLAIRSTEPEAVQRAVGLADPTPCSLADGLTATSEHALFISPPIRGWIIVTGTRLPDPAEDVDECFLWLRNLSERLGEVQFFGANRALSIHAWARLLSGEVFRAYAWAGSTIWNQGEMTRAERDLGMRCPGYGEDDVDGLLCPGDDPMSNTDKVPLLAARWSIDPARIDTDRQWPRPGMAGDFSRQ